MKKAWLALGASALILTGSLAGAVAYASSTEAAAVKDARDDATRGEKLLWSGKTQKAVKLLESAVALRPQDASYRALLGQAYMKDGRFTAARQAFQDAFTLDPSNGRVALNLALVQTAAGDWTGARKLLQDHAATIPARDLGLALALAGDPNAAVELLTAAAQQPGADAKTRQNLALALALAGRWPEAKVVAALDLPPDQVDKRLLQWASFAKPKGAADQVAALLGVTPVADPGQPEKLALSASSAPVLAAVTPVEKTAPAPVVQPQAAPVVVAAATVPAEDPATKPGIATAATETTPPVVAVTAVPSAASQPETIAAPALPTKVALRSAAHVVRVARAAAHAPAAGRYYVQLGAYPNAAIAKDAWHRMHGFMAFRDQAPAVATVTVKGASFYRLSVGGFAHGDADSLCRSWRANGGRCFVRTSAGDAVANWAKVGAPKLAARKAKAAELASR